MGWCKKDAIPLLTHWSYVFLARTYRDDGLRPNRRRNIIWTYNGLVYWGVCIICLDELHNRDQFMNAPAQWETTLHCNAVSHWLGAYKKWSMISRYGQNAINCCTLLVTCEEYFLGMNQGFCVAGTFLCSAECQVMRPEIQWDVLFNPNLENLALWCRACIAKGAGVEHVEKMTTNVSLPLSMEPTPGTIIFEVKCIISACNSNNVLPIILCCFYTVHIERATFIHEKSIQKI